MTVPLHSPAHPPRLSAPTPASRYRPIALASILAVAALATGCTIHRVGCVTSEARAAIAVNQVQITPKPTPGHRPLGMMWIKIMPIMRSNPDSRAALGKESAATLGYNTVSGLLSLEDVYAKWPLGIALLSDTAKPSTPSPAKFTVCMPPPTTTEGKMSTAAAGYLRQEIQYVAAEKGYYVYFTDAPDVTLATLQDGTCSADALAEPMGARPDFVLIAELTKVHRSGTEVLIASQDLEFNLTLVDVDSRKPVWNVTTKGGMSEGIFLGIGLSLATSRDEDLREATRNATLQALKTLPVIPQYRQLK